MEVSDQRHATAALPLGENPRTHRRGGWAVRFGHFEDEEISDGIRTLVFTIQ